MDIFIKRNYSKLKIEPISRVGQKGRRIGLTSKDQKFGLVRDFVMNKKPKILKKIFKM